MGDLSQIGNRDAKTRRAFLEPELLIIDEIGYTKLRPDHARSLFDLVTARYERGSIIVTSNLNFTDWGPYSETMYWLPPCLTPAASRRGHHHKRPLLPDAASFPNRSIDHPEG